MKLIATAVLVYSLGISSIALAQSSNIHIEWGAGPPGSKQWQVSIAPNSVVLFQTYAHYEREDSSEHTIVSNLLVECALTPIQFRALSSNIYSSGIYTVIDRISDVPNLLFYSISREGELIGRFGGVWDGFHIRFTDGETRKILLQGYSNEYLMLCKALGMIDPVIKREIVIAIEWLAKEVSRVAEADPGPLQTDETYNIPEQSGPGYPPQGVGSPDP